MSVEIDPCGSRYVMSQSRPSLSGKDSLALVRHHSHKDQDSLRNVDLYLELALKLGVICMTAVSLREMSTGVRSARNAYL